MAERSEALTALDVLAGEWTAEVVVPGVPPGRCAFEWALGGAYLVQRTETPQPEYPDSMAIIAPDPETGGYTYHYFDSRGVTRIYAMGLHDGLWTLRRDKPDFSPLHFAQRFEGRFARGGDAIEARWETSHDGGATWELDFGMRFTRIGDAR